MNKDYIKQIDGAERRYAIAGMTVEKRAEGDGEMAVVEGYAAKYDKRTTIGSWFEEEIAPGFFDDVLKDDVRCLFNHNPNFILARSNNGKGTLEIWLEADGLKYRYTTPDRQYARDLADAIEKGDVTQSSFAFKPKEVQWIERDGELSVRRLIKCETLYDVSPVTYPAYADTEVAKRSFDAYQKEKETEQRSDDDKGLSFVAREIIINENL